MATSMKTLGAVATFEVRNPATGALVGRYPIHRQAEVDHAVAGACGLGGTVLSRHSGRAIVDRIRADGVSINSFVTHTTIPTLQLGGVGDSGFGRVHGPDGLEEFAYAKATTRQLFPSPLPSTTFRRTTRIDEVADRLVALLHARSR